MRRRITSTRWLALTVVAGSVGAALIIDGLIGLPTASAAQPSVDLQTATPFAVLAGTTVTNTGPSVISGDLGVSPGSAVTHFPPGVVIDGTQHVADAVALQAQSDLTTAYNDAAGRTPVTAVSADLGGQTLVSGVYKATSGMGLTGTVTLDAQGDPSAVFVFQAGSTLITASNSTVKLINGAQACNVFWQVGSSATLGTHSTFVGSILALTSATVQTGTTVAGRVLARNGQVSLDDNTITRPGCAVVSPTSSPTPSPSPSTSVTASTSPSPSTSVSPPATISPTSTSTETTSPTSTPTGVLGPGPTAVPTKRGPSKPVSASPQHPVANTSTTPTPSRSTHAPTPVATTTSGHRSPGVPRQIPPGFPQTGAGGAAPTGDAGSSALIAGGGVALLGAGIALGQATRRSRGSAKPA